MASLRPGSAWSAVGISDLSFAPNHMASSSRPHLRPVADRRWCASCYDPGVIRLGLALVALTLSLLTLPLRAHSEGELRLNDARHRLVIRVEPKGPGFMLWDGD